MFDDTLEQIDEGGDEHEVYNDCYVFICRSAAGGCPDSPNGGCDWCYRVHADDVRTTEEIMVDVERLH